MKIFECTCNLNTDSTQHNMQLKHAWEVVTKCIHLFRMCLPPPMHETSCFFYNLPCKQYHAVETCMCLWTRNSLSGVLTKVLHGVVHAKVIMYIFLETTSIICLAEKIKSLSLLQRNRGYVILFQCLHFFLFLDR